MQLRKVPFNFDDSSNCTKEGFKSQNQDPLRPNYNDVLISKIKKYKRLAEVTVTKTSNLYEDKRNCFVS